MNNIWDNIRFREFLRYVFPFEVNQILELYSVSTDLRLNNEYQIRSVGISYVRRISFNIIHVRCL